MKTQIMMRIARTWIIKSEIRTALLVFGILIVIISPFVYIYSISFKDVLANVVGSLFDLAVFGILLVVFNRMRENAKQIEDLRDRIDDFRDWKSAESKARILGATRRLKDLGVTKFDLNRCGLSEAIIDGYTFIDSDLNCVNFSKATIRNCLFMRCNLRGAQLSLANITDSKFIECDLDSANFFQANIFRTDFSKSNLMTFSEKNNTNQLNILYECTGLNQGFLAEIQAKAEKILEKPTVEKVNRIDFYTKAQQKMALNHRREKT